MVKGQSDKLFLCILLLKKNKLLKLLSNGVENNWIKQLLFNSP